MPPTHWETLGRRNVGHTSASSMTSSSVSQQYHTPLSLLRSLLESVAVRGTDGNDSFQASSQKKRVWAGREGVKGVRGRVVRWIDGKHVRVCLTPDDPQQDGRTPALSRDGLVT